MKKTLALLAGLIVCVLLGVQGYGHWARAHAIKEASTPAFGNVIGAVDAPYTIVEFVDYRCPHCQTMNDRLTQALADEKDVRVVVRPLPWLGSESVAVSRLALAAGLQGKDIIFHNAVMTSGGVRTYTEASGIAQDIGVDLDKATTTIKAQGVDQYLRDNMMLTKKLHIKSIPALLINGKVFVPATEKDIPTVAQLRQMIDAAKNKKN